MAKRKSAKGQTTI